MVTDRRLVIGRNGLGVLGERQSADWSAFLRACFPGRYIREMKCRFAHANIRVSSSFMQTIRSVWVVLLDVQEIVLRRA